MVESMGDPALDALPPPVRRPRPAGLGVDLNGPRRPEPMPTLAIGNPHLVGIASAVFLAPEEVKVLAGGPSTSLDRLDAERVGQAFAHANAAYFRFDLAGISDDDGPTRHSLRSGDEIPGVSRLRSERKLTMVLPVGVSGSGAALLRFPQLPAEAPLVPGEIVIFPAFLYARLSMGERSAADVIIGYAVGNSFR